MTTVAGAAVVVGVDGSPNSLRAVEVAASEAAARRRSLRIVYVLNESRPWPLVSLPPGAAEVAPESPRERAGDQLAEAVAIACQVAPEACVSAELVTGRPSSVLSDESRSAELLVVGERGVGGLLLGTVAIQVAANADCPVLVVRGEPRCSGPVVVGVDGSAEAVRVLDFALEEASLRGVPLVALHAWCGRDRTELDQDPTMSPAFWSGDAQERRVLAEALAGAGARYPDVPIRRQVVRGNAGSLLSEWSQASQLVVVGVRSHDELTALSPVSRHLIFRAECPTAIVRNSART